MYCSLDEVGLAAGVGAINHRALEQMRGSLEPGAKGMGVEQGLVGGRHEAEHLLVAQAAEVLGSELDKHVIGYGVIK